MAKKKKKETELIPLSQLNAELFQTREALDAAYVRFNWADDPELVEACIFAINALQSKYSYLLRCIKRRTGYPVSQASERRAQPAEPVRDDAVAAAKMNGGNICHW